MSDAGAVTVLHERGRRQRDQVIARSITTRRYRIGLMFRTKTRSDAVIVME